MNGDAATVEGFIQKAYDDLKASDAASALSALKTALKLDFEHPEVMYALKCLNWWLERIEHLAGFQDPFDRGGFILSQWKFYYRFLDRIGEHYDLCQYALRRFVYSRALSAFRERLGEGVNQQDPEILYQVGCCYKGVGNFEKALKYLGQAVRFKREGGAALSELADINALLGDSRAAKVLFREAFYQDPQGIDLRSLESDLILRLRDKVRERGYEGEELAEWIPVYGYLWGVFSIKRELKQVEAGRLRDSILSLENEFRNRPRGPVKPRLINRYFWLIDHYENTREDPNLVEEIVLKIKILDPAIYELYRS
jgi:tetratricopeptide (TPR) repeat protein